MFGVRLSVLLVWLMSLVTASGRGAECHSDKDAISCYQCTSTSLSADHFCGDPFNSTHPALNKQSCKGYCAKWVVEFSKGVFSYTRTCSSSLNIRMHKYAVCMREGGSSNGHLCLCQEKECNGSGHVSSSIVAILILTIFQLFILHVFPL